MEGIELLRLKNDKAMRQELWMGWLPQEMLKLSEELSFVDKILSDERFLSPSGRDSTRGLGGLRYLLRYT